MKKLISVISLVSTCALAQDISVSGFANPWLAGMPNGTQTAYDDIVPDQSPVLVSEQSSLGGNFYIFRATGLVAQGPLPADAYTAQGPDGNYSSEVWAYSLNGYVPNGIAGLTAPFDALVGVFLGPSEPTVATVPAALRFDGLASLDYLVLAPELQQPFFIGDGVTSTGIQQQVIAPAGATRLFLGVMDNYYWGNNIGSFTVSVQVVPEPSAFSLLILTFALLPLRRHFFGQ